MGNHGGAKGSGGFMKFFAQINEEVDESESDS